jgi:hypothetical protein
MKPLGILKNQHGFMSAHLIALLLMLMAVPLYLMGNDKKNEIQMKQALEEKRNNQTHEFANNLYYIMKSKSYCTENLKHLGLQGQPITALNKYNYKPFVLNTDGSNSGIEILGAGGPLSANLKNIALTRSELSYVDNKMPLSATSSGYYYTQIAKWRLYFASNKVDHGSISVSRIEEIDMFIETDLYYNIVSCQLTRLAFGKSFSRMDFGESGYVQDIACRSLKGPNYYFELKDSQCKAIL